MSSILTPKRIAAALLTVFASAAIQAEETVLTIPVTALPNPPKLDGNLSDWGSAGWIKVPIKPAVAKEDRAKLGLDPEDKNHTGNITVQLKAGVAAGKLYIAAKWPDDKADVDYQGWAWKNDKYVVDSKRRDDMFAVRFHMDGQYDRSMLTTEKSYKVDVWLWSAGRSNAAGLAEDMVHVVSNKPLEDVAEYEIPGKGMVYIKKTRDDGIPSYEVVPKPKTREGDLVPSIRQTGKASGSVADVEAKGAWKTGGWGLEMGRKLSTGSPDDVAFQPGKKILGQIAVFNRGSSEHKSVSEVLSFDFSALK